MSIESEGYNERRYIEISRNKRFVFIEFENAKILAHVLQILVDIIGLNIDKLSKNEISRQFTLSFNHSLSIQDEEKIEILNRFLEDLSKFLSKNENKIIDINGFIDYYFNQRTLN